MLLILCLPRFMRYAPRERNSYVLSFLQYDSWDRATPLSLDGQCIPDGISCRSAIEYCLFIRMARDNAQRPGLARDRTPCVAVICLIWGYCCARCFRFIALDLFRPRSFPAFLTWEIRPTSRLPGVVRSDFDSQRKIVWTFLSLSLFLSHFCDWLLPH